MFDLPILLVLGAGKTARKITKYFSLSVLNWNLNHSNLSRTLDPMDFLKWDIFSGSPGMVDKLSDI